MDPLTAKIHLSKDIPVKNCLTLKCDPMLLTINSPLTAEQNPRAALGTYGLGADVTGTNPVRLLSLKPVDNLIRGVLQPTTGPGGI